MPLRIVSHVWFTYAMTTNEHATAPECRDCEKPALNGLDTCDTHTPTSAAARTRMVRKVLADAGIDAPPVHGDALTDHNA